MASTLKAPIENQLHAINQGGKWLAADCRCQGCSRHMLAYDLIRGFCPFCIDYMENWK
jgi:hypothetical protein